MSHCSNKNCCCNNNYDENIIETACKNCGVSASYYSENNNSCACGFEHGESVFPRKSNTCSKLCSYSKNE